MDTLIGNRTLANVAGAAGVLGQLAAAYWFVLFPALVVPTPINYLFVVAWLVLVGLAIASWRHHPWRSFLIPVVSVPVVIVALEVGVRLMGWAP